MYGGRNPAVRNAYFTAGEFHSWRHLNVDPDRLHPTSYFEIIPGNFRKKIFKKNVKKI